MISKCPVKTCAYWSCRNASGCLLETQGAIPEPGELREAQIRKHKGLTPDDFKSEKTRALRFVKRGTVLLRFSEWEDQQAPEWFQLRAGYEDRNLREWFTQRLTVWPWNISVCNWTPGKMLMALRESSWTEFSKTHKMAASEPYLRILRLSAEEAEDMRLKFVHAHKRVITTIGASS